MLVHRYCSPSQKTPAKARHRKGDQQQQHREDCSDSSGDSDADCSSDGETVSTNASDEAVESEDQDSQQQQNGDEDDDHESEQQQQQQEGGGLPSPDLAAKPVCKRNRTSQGRARHGVIAAPYESEPMELLPRGAATATAAAEAPEDARAAAAPRAAADATDAGGGGGGVDAFICSLASCEASLAHLAGEGVAGDCTQEGFGGHGVGSLVIGPASLSFGIGQLQQQEQQVRRQKQGGGGEADGPASLEWPLFSLPDLTPAFGMSPVHKQAHPSKLPQQQQQQQGGGGTSSLLQRKQQQQHLQQDQQQQERSPRAAATGKGSADGRTGKPQHLQQRSPLALQPTPAATVAAAAGGRGKAPLSCLDMGRQATVSRSPLGHARLIGDAVAPGAGRGHVGGGRNCSPCRVGTDKATGSSSPTTRARAAAAAAATARAANGACNPPVGLGGGSDSGKGSGGNTGKGRGRVRDIPWPPGAKLGCSKCRFSTSGCEVCRTKALKKLQEQQQHQEQQHEQEQSGEEADGGGEERTRAAEQRQQGGRGTPQQQQQGSSPIVQRSPHKKGPDVGIGRLRMLTPDGEIEDDQAADHGTAKPSTKRAEAPAAATDAGQDLGTPKGRACPDGDALRLNKHNREQQMGEQRPRMQQPDGDENDASRKQEQQRKRKLQHGHEEDGDLEGAQQHNKRRRNSSTAAAAAAGVVDGLASKSPRGLSPGPVRAGKGAGGKEAGKGVRLPRELQSLVSPYPWSSWEEKNKYLAGEGVVEIEPQPQQQQQQKQQQEGEQGQQPPQQKQHRQRRQQELETEEGGEPPEQDLQEDEGGERGERRPGSGKASGRGRGDRHQQQQVGSGKSAGVQKRGDVTHQQYEGAGGLRELLSRHQQQETKSPTTPTAAAVGKGLRSPAPAAATLAAAVGASGGCGAAGGYGGGSGVAERNAHAKQAGASGAIAGSKGGAAGASWWQQLRAKARRCSESGSSAGPLAGLNVLVTGFPERLVRQRVLQLVKRMGGTVVQEVPEHVGDKGVGRPAGGAAGGGEEGGGGMGRRRLSSSSSGSLHWAAPAGGEGGGHGQLIDVTLADGERNTPKYLFAAAVGCPVVTKGWLEACAAAGTLLPPQQQQQQGEEEGEGGVRGAAGGGGAMAGGDGGEVQVLLPARAHLQQHPVLLGARVKVHGSPEWCKVFGNILRHAGKRHAGREGW